MYSVSILLLFCSLLPLTTPAASRLTNSETSRQFSCSLFILIELLTSVNYLIFFLLFIFCDIAVVSIRP